MPDENTAATTTSLARDEVFRRAGQLLVSSVFGGMFVYLLQAIFAISQYEATNGPWQTIAAYSLFAWFIVYLAVAYLANDFGAIPGNRIAGFIYDIIQIFSVFSALYGLGFIATDYKLARVFGIDSFPWAFGSIAAIALFGLIAHVKATGRDVVLLNILRGAAIVPAVVIGFVWWNSDKPQKPEQLVLKLTTFGLLAWVCVLLGVYARMRLAHAVDAEKVRPAQATTTEALSQLKKTVITIDEKVAGLNSRIEKLENPGGGKGVDKAADAGATTGGDAPNPAR